MPEKILISACLFGRPVRYDGSAKTLRHPFVTQWQAEGRLVPFCPEVGAGMPIPRPPAEIADGASSADVLAGKARVIERGGRDVTDLFTDGARMALKVALAKSCSFALLIDGSPSCGSLTIYDGSFSGRRHPGMGITAALLRANGVEVFSDADIEDLAKRLA